MLQSRPGYPRGLEPGIIVTSLVDKTNECSRIVYITGKRAHHHAHNATFGLFAAASGSRLTGWYHIHLLSFI